jgi:flagellar hook-associated protein 2
VSIQGKIQDFVTQYNSTIDFIQSKINEKRVANPQNASDRAQGVLNGDAALTGLLSSLRNAAADIVQGRPDTMKVLSQAGLSTGAAVGSGTLNQDALAGKLTLDTTKLASALATSLGDVKALFTNPTTSYATQGLAQRLSSLVNAQLGSGGVLTARIATSNASISAFTKSIGDWTTRLADKQKQLQQQFTNMETALSQAQSQGSWLSAQVAKM